MAVGKDKSRKHMSFSQWAKHNKRMLQGVKIENPYPNDNKNWRKSREYRRWREWCLLRDEYHCQFCGASKKLTVHHIVPASVCPELKYEIRNGLTLCIPCHQNNTEQIHQMKPRFWKNLKRNRIR